MKAYIARDKYGFLFLYREQPERRCDLILSECLYGKLRLSNELFPDLKWEDGPVEVELYIQKKK